MDSNKCIIDSRNNSNKIMSKMEAEITLKKEVFGKQISYFLTINATKAPQLPEVYLRYKSIIRGGYP